MVNLPPPPPAVTAQATPTAEALVTKIREMNGTPVYKTGTLKTRVVGACWSDLAYPSGWKPAPMLPSVPGCARPDLRTAEGQHWQKLLDGAPLNTPDSAQLAVR